MSEESCRQPETSPDAAQSNTTILSGDRNEQLKQLLELKWKHAHPRACSSVLLDYRSQDSLDLLPQRGFECELGPESESEPEQDLESESEPEQDLESEPELEPELTFLEKTWQVLHILLCKQLADLDPKRNALVPTRVCKFNIAFFNLDIESAVIHGPPLKELPSCDWSKTVASSVNIVSLKVIKSDVGYPISVFGIVLARDAVDYKCVYLFKRGRDDPQLINSSEDELTLTGPRRAFIARDSMFFEINLKIKGASGIAEGDFSKGVVEHNLNCYGGRAMARCLTSWRSTVELVCIPVRHPVEATLEVKILEGPHGVPFRGKVIAWTDDFEENPMTLFEYDDDSSEEVAGGQGLVRDDGSLALARNLIAVPINRDDGEMVLNVCFVGNHDENEGIVVALQYPCEEEFCTYGSYVLQLKVAWKAILTRPMSREVHNRLFSLPQPQLTVNSWMWELVFQGSRGSFGENIIYDTY
ncbi:hypothetical protein CFC21_069621 [Triticum aestivum]|uniref:DUF6598 domain-containing protein n=2 Tax=Triticum aestivum TaxID=4565 RepID=A0A9R1HDD4_WHEAT|nr:hypothetical protein CFC21_069621 [Triticum aestivum]